MKKLAFIVLPIALAVAGVCGLAKAEGIAKQTDNFEHGVMDYTIIPGGNSVLTIPAYGEVDHLLMFNFPFDENKLIQMYEDIFTDPSRGENQFQEKYQDQLISKQIEIDSLLDSETLTGKIAQLGFLLTALGHYDAKKAHQS